MIKDIKVSIITATYNSEKTIRRTLESVINQTYRNIQYIIVDGESSDATLKIINEYRRKIDLHVVSEKDKGIYDAMNKGISLANGEIVGIINSDDWYEVDALQKVVDRYVEGNKSIIYGMTRFWNGDKEEATIMYHHNNLKNQMICHPSCFVSKDIYMKIGYFDLKYKSSADYDFFLRAITNEEISFMPIYEVLANFSTGGTSASLLGMKETLEIKKVHNIIGEKKYLYERLKLFMLTLKHLVKK